MRGPENNIESIDQRLDYHNKMVVDFYMYIVKCIHI